MSNKVSIIVVAAGLALSSAASAQSKNLGADVAALRGELEGLKPSAAQVPTLAAAIQELEGRLTRLEADLNTAIAAGGATEALTTRVDEIQLELKNLSAETEGLRTELASSTQASASGASGGVTHAKGFQWKTGDGKYELGIGGYLQFRGTGATNGDFDAAEELGFRVRRARLVMAGHVADPKLTYKIQLETFATKPLLDFYGEYEINKYLSVRFGQDKVQFTRNYMTSSTKLTFVDRPTAGEALRYDRDLGAQLRGQVGDRVAYVVSAVNGAGKNAENDNIDFAWVARADFAVLGELGSYGYGDIKGSDKPNLSVSIAGAHDLTAVPKEFADSSAPDGKIKVATDVDGDGNHDNVRVVSLSADAQFRYRGLAVSAEGFYRHESWGSILEGNDDLAVRLGRDGSRHYFAGFGEATYMVMPKKLLVGARFGYADLAALGLGDQADKIQTADHQTQVDALVQLYHGDGHRTLGLNYTFFDYGNDKVADPASDKEHQLILEYQLML